VADRISTDPGPGQTLQVSLSTATPLDGSGLRLPVATVRGRLVLTVELVCDMAAVPRNVPASFDVVDAAVSPAGPEAWKTRLAEVGLSWSDSAEVRWFRYLTTKPGKNATRFDLTLPDELELRGVTLRKWRRPETAVTVHRVTLATGDPA
jgi:hypothetical protein